MKKLIAKGEGVELYRVVEGEEWFYRIVSQGVEILDYYNLKDAWSRFGALSPVFKRADEMHREEEGRERKKMMGLIRSYFSLLICSQRNLNDYLKV